MKARIVWKTPGPQPNGLQAAPDGLWVMDQVDDRIYKLRYEDGSPLATLPTRAKHSSGITLDTKGGVWVASTFGYELIRYDPASGEVVGAFPTPEDPSVGAHGLEWRDGALWVNVPRTATIYRLDPRDGRVLHRVPAPGNRPHGMAWEDGALAAADWPTAPPGAGPLTGPTASPAARPGLWCVETNHRAIYLLEPTTGSVVDEVKVDGPEPHGLTIWRGQFWLCDAGSREVFVIDLPSR